MVEGYIYKYTAPDGAVYIGQTTNLVLRRAKWRSKSGYTRGLVGEYRRIFPPDAWNFDIIDSVVCSTSENLNKTLNERECYWIGYYTAVAKLTDVVLLDIAKGGGNRKVSSSVGTLEVLVNKIAASKSKEDAFGEVDVFDENGLLIKSGSLRELKTKGKSMKEIMRSCDSHEWLGYRTYRRHGECVAVDPCPYRVVKRNGAYYKPKKKLLYIYNALTEELVATAKTYNEVAKHVGPDTEKISAVVKGARPQYNGYVVRSGDTPPSHEDYCEARRVMRPKH